MLAGRTLFFAAVKALALRLLRSTTLTPCVFEGSYTNSPRVDICRETAFFATFATINAGDPRRYVISRGARSDGRNSYTRANYDYQPTRPR